MNDESTEWTDEERLEMIAKSAAPYLHPNAQYTEPEMYDLLSAIYKVAAGPVELLDRAKLERDLKWSERG